MKLLTTKDKNIFSTNCTWANVKNYYSKCICFIDCKRYSIFSMDYELPLYVGKDCIKIFNQALILKHIKFGDEDI